MARGRRPSAWPSWRRSRRLSPPARPRPRGDDQVPRPTWRPIRAGRMAAGCPAGDRPLRSGLVISGGSRSSVRPRASGGSPPIGWPRGAATTPRWRKSDTATRDFMVAFHRSLGANGPVAAAVPRLGPAPNFALTTSQGARVWLTQLRPRVVVLTFSCLACDACAGALPTLVDLGRELGEAAGRRAFFVYVSVDSAHDTPAALRTFARAHGLLAPAWLLLTGEPGEIDVVTRRYDVPVRRE